jgi:DNA-binding transcriptional ArsR family regulator
MKDRRPTCEPHEHPPTGGGAVAQDVAGLDRAARLFRALGDAPRLQLLQLLTDGERCVTEIVAAVGEKFSTVSQRLRLLRTEGLVARRRQGKHIFYALADRHVSDLIHNALAHAAELAAAPEDKEGE